MTARQKTAEVLTRLNNRGIAATFDDAEILRRAELSLQRWSEGECGNSNDYNSSSIERDEKTGKPYRCVYPHKGDMRRYPIADREAGALRRVQSVCQRLGVNYYHQTDPRGCTLYVSTERLTESDYSRGVSVCV